MRRINILAMGRSVSDFVIMCLLNEPHKFVIDAEVWVVPEGMASVFKHDRAFTCPKEAILTAIAVGATNIGLYGFDYRYADHPHVADIEGEDEVAAIIKHAVANGVKFEISSNSLLLEKIT